MALRVFALRKKHSPTQNNSFENDGKYMSWKRKERRLPDFFSCLRGEYAANCIQTARGKYRMLSYELKTYRALTLWASSPPLACPAPCWPSPGDRVLGWLYGDCMVIVCFKLHKHLDYTTNLSGIKCSIGTIIKTTKELAASHKYALLDTQVRSPT